MERTIAVFGASRSLPGDKHYEDSVRCGRLLAEAGFAVATGGYAGSMEATSLGADQADGRVLGVTAPSVFRNRESANAYVSEERPATSLVDRIGILTQETAGAIALWGSLGTATELLVAWNLAYVAPLAQMKRKPVVAVGEPWETMVPHLEEVLSTTPGLVTIVSDVESAVLEITNRLRTSS